MHPTKVDDSEDAYRAIRANGREYARVNGVIKFSATAFDDREKKPSVDRSSIRTKPEEARVATSDGVTKVGALEVRKSCKVDITDAKGKSTGTYAVDVIHRPILASATGPENLAHCQIECAPQIDSSSRFKKLKEALANIATKHGFIVQPVEI
jgi:hypothetical protein